MARGSRVLSCPKRAHKRDYGIEVIEGNNNVQLEGNNFGVVEWRPDQIYLAHLPERLLGCPASRGLYQINLACHKKLTQSGKLEGKKTCIGKTWIKFSGPRAAIPFSKAQKIGNSGD